MSLKSRIEALILQISNAKISLRDALRHKGVDPGSQPSFEALRLGIERIQSSTSLIGKGSIFSTRLDTNETARRMVMASDKSTFTMKISCNLGSTQSSTESALDKINGSFHKGDLVVIITYATPIYGNHGLCIHNLSEGLFSYFFGYGSSHSMEEGYPWVQSALFLESVNITAITTDTGKYHFSFTGYALKAGQSPVN